MLAKMLALAHTYATPLRMDETNDISCEGEPGVSNAFASALWALDYTARAMTAGVVGVNFHDLIDQPRTYSALAARSESALNAGELQPAPEWYALLAAHTLVGSRPLPTTTAGTAPGELSAERTGRPRRQGEPRAGELRPARLRAARGAPARPPRAGGRQHPAPHGPLTRRDHGHPPRRRRRWRPTARGPPRARCPRSTAARARYRCRSAPAAPPW